MKQRRQKHRRFTREGWQRRYKRVLRECVSKAVAPLAAQIEADILAMLHTARHREGLGQLLYKKVAVGSTVAS